MDRVRDAGALAAEQQDIVRTVGEPVEGLGRTGGEQHDPARPGPRRGLELRPAGVTDDLPRRSIIEGGSTDRPVGQGKRARLDHVEGGPQAGGQPDGRAKVLRNVRLKKGQTHSNRSLITRYMQRQ